MQFPQFHTPSVLLKRFFKNNPEQLKSYVQVGLVAAKVVVTPLSSFLKHLIEIQGMDPNTEPGRRMKEQFQNAINSVFQNTHVHDYDTNFDFSWLNKKFEQTRKDLEQLDLSKEDFRKMTDVGNLRATKALDVDQMSPAPFEGTTLRADFQSGVPVTIDQSPVQELASLLGVPVDQSALKLEPVRDVFNKESWLKAYRDIHANPPRLELPNDKNELKDALQRLFKWSEDLKYPTDPKVVVDQILSFDADLEQQVNPVESIARTQELKNLKKTLERYGAPSRSIKKSGKIRRTPTGKVDAVKATPKKSPKPVKKTLNRITLSQPVVDYEKEADEIQRLIKFQKLEPRELDLLVSEGLDSRSVDAWKTKYGDKHFTEGSTLKQNLRAKHTAATDLANEMVARGLCDKNGVSEQIAEILKFSDDSLDSLKNVIMKHPVLNLRADGKDLFRLEVLEKKQELSDKKFRSGKGSFKRSAQKIK
jgi:hypothetical protein